VRGGSISDFNTDRIFTSGKVLVECCYLLDHVVPAGCDDERIVREKRICPCDLFDANQVHRIRNNHKTGKDFVQVPDKFIRKSVSLAPDMFLEFWRAADAELVLCNETQAHKKCFFIHRHARGTGIGERRIKVPGFFCYIRFDDQRNYKRSV